MGRIKLTTDDKYFLETNYPELKKFENKIEGEVKFKREYKGVKIQDSYKILIALNLIDENTNLPRVFIIDAKIKEITEKLKIPQIDLHLIKNGEICLGMPPEVKKEFPFGFNVVVFMDLIEKHLFFISYFYKFGKPPWPEYAHGEKGLYQYYQEKPKEGFVLIKEKFKLPTRQLTRNKIRELQKKYKNDFK